MLAASADDRGGAPRIGRTISCGGNRLCRRRCAAAAGLCARHRSRRADGEWRTRAEYRRDEGDRCAGSPPAAARAGVAHSRQQGILDALAHRHARSAGAAAGNGNGGRSRARCAFAPEAGEIAHPRYRHRVGRSAAGAAERIAECGWHRHRYQRRRACTSRARTRNAMRWLRVAASWPATSPPACRARSISSFRTRLMWRTATSQRSRRRCATTTRRLRSMAAPMGWMVTAPSPATCAAPAGAGQADLIVELGAGQERAVA